MTFGLHENMILDRPLIVRCDLAIDVDDLPLIFRLAAGEKTPEEFPDGVQGMLQIKSFTPLDANVAMDNRRWNIWRQARTQNHLLDRNIPIGKNPTGLIDFHMEGTDQVLTSPFHILDGATNVATAFSRGKDILCPFTGRMVRLSKTAMSIIGFVNFDQFLVQISVN